MEVSKPLSVAEIDDLAEFLISEETPNECMDISTLDGFLTDLGIGSDTTPTSRWIPVVWGQTKQAEIAWKSRETMDLW